MEKLNGNYRQNFHKRPPGAFMSPMKIASQNFRKPLISFPSIIPFKPKVDDKKIIELIKQSQYQYRSILSQIGKIFQDEPNSPKLQAQRETYETEEITHMVDRKGFQYHQTSANNPIQDSICSFEIPQLNAFVISIFDGHGGHELSTFCAHTTKKYLQKYIKNGINLHKYEKNKVQLIKDGLMELHFELQNQFYKQYLKKIQNQNKKIKNVGTCAITLVLYQNKVIVANCGDSQSMTISQDRGSYNYQKLSERFSVSNKAQRKRLIEEFKGVDQNIIIEERKNVYYLKGVLQPTKSIGDYYLKHREHYMGQDQFKGPYISCQPDIRVYDLKQHDKYIVVASDGLWDYLNKWEILKYVIESKYYKLNIAERETESEAEEEIQSKQPKSGPQYLVQKILQKVSNHCDIDVNLLKNLQAGEKRSYHDDITIAIIDIKEFFDKETVTN